MGGGRALDELHLKGFNHPILAVENFAGVAKRVRM